MPKRRTPKRYRDPEKLARFAEKSKMVTRRMRRNREHYDNLEAVGHAQFCRCCSGRRGGTKQCAWHHIIPHAQGGRYERSNLVSLCTRCHELVHETWGGGLDYTGPVTRDQLLQRLKALLPEPPR